MNARMLVLYLAVSAARISTITTLSQCVHAPRLCSNIHAMQTRVNNHFLITQRISFPNKYAVMGTNYLLSSYNYFCQKVVTNYFLTTLQEK